MVSLASGTRSLFGEAGQLPSQNLKFGFWGSPLADFEHALRSRHVSDLLLPADEPASQGRTPIAVMRLNFESETLADLGRRPFYVPLILRSSSAHLCKILPAQRESLTCQAMDADPFTCTVMRPLAEKEGRQIVERRERRWQQK
jgi:hypothetical protein